MGIPVKLVGLGSGFAMGMFGNTHYGIEDITLMRAIPNLCILSPADCTEVVKATVAASRDPGAGYLRLTGITNNPIVNKEDYAFEIGTALTLKKGSDIAIIATGSTAPITLLLQRTCLKPGGSLQRSSICIR